MSNKNQKNNGPKRTGDFVESLDSFEAAIDTMKEYAEEALLNLASAYRHSRGSDKLNVGYLVEEFGQISDALVVIEGILGCQLAPREEGK